MIKALKKEFNIKHIVHRREGKFCIGSPYVSELISINADGQIKHSSLITPNKDELGKILYAIQNTPPEKLRALMAEPETFLETKTVYTEQGRGRIKSVQCEETGWPNVTVTGGLMYENTHFENRKEALSHSKGNSIAGIKCWSQALVKDAKGTVKKSYYLLCEIGCLLRIVLLRGH